MGCGILSRPRELSELLGRERLVDPRPVPPLESIAASRRKHVGGGGAASSAAAAAAALQQRYLDLWERLLVAKAVVGAPAPTPGGDLSSYLAVVDAACGDRGAAPRPSNLACDVAAAAPAIPPWVILVDALDCGRLSRSWPSLGNAVVRYDPARQSLARAPCAGTCCRRCACACS